MVVVAVLDDADFLAAALFLGLVVFSLRVFEVLSGVFSEGRVLVFVVAHAFTDLTANVFGAFLGVQHVLEFLTFSDESEPCVFKLIEIQVLQRFELARLVTKKLNARFVHRKWIDVPSGFFQFVQAIDIHLFLHLFFSLVD